IDRATTLDTAGKFADAKTALEAALAHAKGIDYAELFAGLHLALGNVTSKTDPPKVAEDWYHKAAEAAARARDTSAYARSWIGLVWVVGAMQARFDDAAPIRLAAAQTVHLAGDPV